jgi:hypothetical protein
MSEQRDIPNTNEIVMYLHCGKCMDERPDHIAPMDWARTQSGWTPMGLQVWCNRCNANLMHVDFEGVKHPANCTRQLTDEEIRARTQ